MAPEADLERFPLLGSYLHLHFTSCHFCHWVLPLLYSFDIPPSIPHSWLSLAFHIHQADFTRVPLPSHLYAPLAEHITVNTLIHFPNRSVRRDCVASNKADLTWLVEASVINRDLYSAQKYIVVVQSALILEGHYWRSGLMWSTTNYKQQKYRVKAIYWHAHATTQMHLQKAFFNSLWALSLISQLDEETHIRALIRGD